MATTTMTLETIKYNFIHHSLESIQGRLVDDDRCATHIRKRTAEVGLAILRREMESIDQIDQRTALDALAMKIRENVAMLPQDTQEVEENAAEAEFLIQIATHSFNEMLRGAEDSATAQLINAICLEILLPKIDAVEDKEDKLMLLQDLGITQRQATLLLGEASREAEFTARVQDLRADSGASS